MLLPCQEGDQLVREQVYCVVKCPAQASATCCATWPTQISPRSSCLRTQVCCCCCCIAKQAANMLKAPRVLHWCIMQTSQRRGLRSPVPRPPRCPPSSAGPHAPCSAPPAGRLQRPARAGAWALGWPPSLHPHCCHLPTLLPQHANSDLLSSQAALRQEHAQTKSHGHDIAQTRGLDRTGWHHTGAHAVSQKPLRGLLSGIVRCKPDPCRPKAERTI